MSDAVAGAPPLQIIPRGPSEPAVDLAECFHAPGGDFAILANARERRLVHARGERCGEGLRWEVARFALDGERIVRALDRTCFEAGTDHFTELAHYRARRGPNLHPAPLRLPRRLALEAPYQPIAGQPASVRLVFAGQVDLRLGALHATARACCLVAEQGAVRRAQWLGQGIGELALGPLDAPFERWLIAHQHADGRVTLDVVPSSLRAAPLPELPESGPAAGGASLF